MKAPETNIFQFPNSPFKNTTPLYPISKIRIMDEKGYYSILSGSKLLTRLGYVHAHYTSSNRIRIGPKINSLWEKRIYFVIQRSSTDYTV